jgi:hypothetical protein
MRNRICAAILAVSIIASPCLCMPVPSVTGYRDPPNPAGGGVPLFTDAGDPFVLIIGNSILLVINEISNHDSPELVPARNTLLLFLAFLGTLLWMRETMGREKDDTDEENVPQHNLPFKPYDR